MDGLQKTSKKIDVEITALNNNNNCYFQPQKQFIKDTLKSCSLMLDTK